MTDEKDEGGAVIHDLDNSLKENLLMDQMSHNLKKDIEDRLEHSYDPHTTALK